ncbi:hypothetical protein N665_0500s0031 [Sinapis alba]|nr:hypothetical protein N665_0500s0031 [Sinapis alba]
MGLSNRSNIRLSLLSVPYLDLSQRKLRDEAFLVAGFSSGSSSLFVGVLTPGSSDYHNVCFAGFRLRDAVALSAPSSPAKSRFFPVKNRSESRSGWIDCRRLIILLRNIDLSV